MTAINRAVSQERLRALHETYGAQLPAKVAHLARRWAVLAAGPWNVEDFAAFHRLVHNLAGSGTTFGWPRISECATALEVVLKPLLESSRPPDESGVGLVEGFLEKLRELSTSEGLPAMPEARTDAPDPRPPVVCLLTSDGSLATQIETFGYQPVLCSDARAFSDAVLRRKPAAVVIDTAALPDDPRAILPADTPTDAPPIVFITDADDVGARLRAVRSGGQAYALRPVDGAWLVDKLDELTARSSPDPARILIVEDDPLLAAHNAVLLEDAGMETRIATDPMTILQPMSEFRPDLVLMDVYMPGCTGLDLAGVIRQHEEYVGIPIVFLSTETRLDRRLQAMMAGGDDFLLKPIGRDYLVSSIAARVRRARTLRSLMERDSLTRLLNHTHLKTKLDAELSRARRSASPLAYAMIDVDHFKAVNDTHGHRAGDRVLKSLARLLVQRFRATDVVGRYGGEEFGVVLSDTTASAAAAAVDQVRATFAKIPHLGSSGPFSVTFSAGIASFPQSISASDLCSAADAALYKAKHAGRNRVAVASAEGHQP